DRGSRGAANSSRGGAAADPGRRSAAARSGGPGPGVVRPGLLALAGGPGAGGAASAAGHPARPVRGLHLGGPDPVPDARCRLRHGPPDPVAGQFRRDERPVLRRRRPRSPWGGVRFAGVRAAGLRAGVAAGAEPALHLVADARPAAHRHLHLHQPPTLAGAQGGGEPGGGPGRHRSGARRSAGRLPHRPVGAAHPSLGSDALPAQHSSAMAVAAGRAAGARRRPPGRRGISRSGAHAARLGAVLARRPDPVRSTRAL
ncbi:MAG: hypothetical protein AVDCRST_MAG61-1993, partial [uncultured Friedmanniella sp.]